MRYSDLRENSAYDPEKSTARKNGNDTMKSALLHENGYIKANTTETFSDNLLEHFLTLQEIGSTTEEDHEVVRFTGCLVYQFAKCITQCSQWWNH